jgi:hypothetical protein
LDFLLSDSVVNVIKDERSPHCDVFTSQTATDLNFLLFLHHQRDVLTSQQRHSDNLRRHSVTSSPSMSPINSPSFLPSTTPRFFNDIILNDKLQTIQAARSALTPPEWSKRQQGHRQGVQRQRYPADKTAQLLKRYRESRYVTREEMDQLAEETGLTRQQVKLPHPFYVCVFYIAFQRTYLDCDLSSS